MITNNEEGPEEVEEIDDDDSAYYYLPKEKQFASQDRGLEVEKRDLARIPTMAIFHKLTVGRGVPHTFVGELYIRSKHRTTLIIF